MSNYKRGFNKFTRDVQTLHEKQTEPEQISPISKASMSFVDDKNYKQHNPHKVVDRQVPEVPMYDNVTLGINTKGDIEELKNFFRGRRLTKDGKAFQKFEGADEVMNEAGAEYLLSNHASQMSISNATTNFKHSDEAKPLVEEYAGNILELLCSKYRDWSVKKEFFDMVIDTLSNSYFLFLLKNVGDKQRSHMSHFKPNPTIDPVARMNM